MLHSYYLYLTTIFDRLLINSASKIVFIMSQTILNLSQTFSEENISEEKVDLDPLKKYAVMFHDDSADSQSTKDTYFTAREEVITPPFREIININTGSSSISSNTNVEGLRRSERLSDNNNDEDKKNNEVVVAEELIISSSSSSKKSSKRVVMELNDNDTPKDVKSSNVKNKKRCVVGLDLIDILDNDEHIKNLSLEWNNLLDNDDYIWKLFREHKNFIKALEAVNTIGNDNSINYYYLKHFISIEFALKKYYKDYPQRRRYYSKIIKLITKAIKWVCIYHYEIHGLDSVLMILYAVLKETNYSFQKAYQNLSDNWLQKDKEKMRLEYRKFLLSNVQYIVFDKCCVVFSDKSGLKNVCLSGKHSDENIKCFRIKDVQQIFDANFIIYKNMAKDLDCRFIPNDGISLFRLKNHIKRIDVDNKFKDEFYHDSKGVAIFFCQWQSEQKVDWNGCLRFIRLPDYRSERLKWLALNII